MSTTKRVGRPPARDEAFKIDCARMMMNRGNRTVAELSRELGVSDKALYRWQAQYKGTLAKPESELAAEVEKMRQEIRTLREERELLKKSITFFVKAGR
jgi:transposase